MSTRIFAGLSAFFANREGNHNWLENAKRPMISLIETTRKGKKKYNDLFVTNDKAVKVSTSDKPRTVKVPANSTVIVFPNDLAVPLFSILHKDD